MRIRRVIVLPTAVGRILTFLFCGTVQGARKAKGPAPLVLFTIRSGLKTSSWCGMKVFDNGQNLGFLKAL